MMFRRLKPLTLYLICIGCILVSRIFEEYGLLVPQYVCVFAGCAFFLLAIVRYFGKSVD